MTPLQQLFLYRFYTIFTIFIRIYSLVKIIPIES